ncbi:hypothetical protein K3888_07775 [Dietzia aurantiaca]|uniref:hypothetical protein n=1 Tax=Dietzia aurantiaca TaxID=983873 RepID=UPI001E47B252|nr:hypothetical protein [Dietzia aurantiaca]MCD2262598.1 hypothetical protein [Dietzia aurantiaca]
MGIVEGLVLLGGLILGPAAGAAAAFGVTPVMVGGFAAGAGAAGLAGGAGVAASVSNPFVIEGVENAAVSGHNDFASGSANVLNGLQLPGIAEFHFN